MPLAEETLAVLGGESGYDLKISKSEGTLSDAAPSGIASGPNLPSSVYFQKIKGM
jgi:hypothetical protein